MSNNPVLLIIGIGVFGIIVLIRPLGFAPAYSTIDHPRIWMRRFFRACAFAIAYLASFLTSSILIGTFFPQYPYWLSNDVTRLVSLIVYPFPLAIVCYLGYLKMARWSDKRNSLPR
jgi:hypothetical protein